METLSNSSVYKKSNIDLICKMNLSSTIALPEQCKEFQKNSK
ncbi:hypothetical protein NIES4106_60750 (plasmid) [Fischerella sp. NIES-4106]|nr:hypothetical protein NIES4106_60750 [Fischerella sp. NIES-4106]